MTGDTLVVEREDVRVMFRRTIDEQESIAKTWAMSRLQLQSVHFAVGSSTVCSTRLQRITGWR